MNAFTGCNIRDNQAGSKDTLAAGHTKNEGKVDLLYLVEEATEDALYETAGTIAEICENNGAVGSVIAEDSKQQRNLLDIRSAIYEVYKPVFVDSLDTAVPVANIGDLL